MAKKRRRNPGEDLTYIPGSMIEGVVINEDTGQVSAIMRDRSTENPRRRRKVKDKANRKRNTAPRKKKKKNAKRRVKTSNRPRFKNGRFKKTSNRRK